MMKIVKLLLYLLPFAMFGQQHQLKYDRPAHYFEETLVIGNGNLGGIVYGGVNDEKISLNDITLWTGQPDTASYNPVAYKSLSLIREALSNEDYRKADNLQRLDQGHESDRYQPLGQLLIKSSAPVTAKNYYRILDIDNSIASVYYEAGSGNYHREYFASAPDSVLIIHMKAERGAKINVSFDYKCLLMHNRKTEGKELVIDGYAAYDQEDPQEYYAYDPSKGIHFRTIVHVENRDGKIEAGDDGLELKDCSEAVVYISNCTSFNGPDKNPVSQGKKYKENVRARIEKAVAKGYDAILNDHISDYKSLFDRFSIDLGTTDEAIAALTTDRQLRNYTALNQANPDLEELYMLFGRYLLKSCSRSEMVPANLQGLWNESILPPWRSNYTVNINLEENYWPAETGNLSELHRPMLEFVQNLTKTGKRTARDFYGINEGWCAAHNSDIWAMTNPVGDGEGNPRWANWNMGGTWMSTHIWEHYLFSRDLQYLKKCYPTLKGAADFCMKWLIPLSSINKTVDTKEGSYLITAPSTSPENSFLVDGYEGETCYGASADLAMIRECLMDTRQAALVLGENESYINEIDAVLKKILPYKIGSNGSLQEWYHDWEDAEPTHRHQSHLFGLYPGHHISVSQTPALAEACKRALEIKGDKTTGWSTGWRVNLQARLHEPEAAYHIYRTLLKYISPDRYKGPDRQTGGGTYPNLLDAHSPFQIDGNFGGTAGVIEMLVQSSSIVKSAQEEENLIELLPALPKAWKKQGSIRGACCRGGYEVSFSWKDGKVTNFTITSKRADKSTLTLLSPNGKPRQITLRPHETKILQP